jgi:hypothetical protein
MSNNEGLDTLVGEPGFPGPLIKLGERVIEANKNLGEILKLGNDHPTNAFPKQGYREPDVDFLKRRVFYLQDQVDRINKERHNERIELDTILAKIKTKCDVYDKLIIDLNELANK